MLPAVAAWALGWGELLIILAIVLILFGVGKLPKVLKSMGEGVREFRKASEDDGKSDDDNKVEPPKEEGEKTL
jgi:sec-independent protein translocase protein TatA